MKYYYTNFGEIYSGICDEAAKFDYPGLTIIIQTNKWKEYIKLQKPEKTLEKIGEYGWVLGNDVIVGALPNGFEPPYSHTQRDEEMWSGSFERKYMFVFGAGASANCVYGDDLMEFKKDNLKPPLGISLFEKRFKKYYEKYQGVRQSLNSLQGGTPDVETIFEEEWKSISKHNNQVVLSRHINIQYYLQEILKDVSNHTIQEYYANNLYAKLFNKLQKKYSESINRSYGSNTEKNFSIVSFNQDTILEDFACTQFNKKIVTIDDYVCRNKGGFSLFKPHGSWNWGWRFPDSINFSGNTSKWLFDNNINFYKLYYELLGNNMDMVDWNRWGDDTLLNRHQLGKFTINKSRLQVINSEPLDNYFPALLLPYRDKDDFTMPLWHFRDMLGYIHNIETLILIGWKGNEAAFNSLLEAQATRLNKVIIVDPNPGIVKENLSDILLKRKIEPIIYDNFEHFVEKGVEEEIK